nr:MAG TPA: hypothetical protein [Bacteriophage sp.]
MNRWNPNFVGLRKINTEADIPEYRNGSRDINRHSEMPLCLRNLPHFSIFIYRMRKYIHKSNLRT